MPRKKVRLNIEEIGKLFDWIYDKGNVSAKEINELYAKFIGCHLTK